MSKLYTIITRIDSNVLAPAIRMDRLSAIVCRNKMFYEYCTKNDININEMDISEDDLCSTEVLWIENGNEFAEWYIYECVSPNEDIS